MIKHLATLWYQFKWSLNTNVDPLHLTWLTDDEAIKELRRLNAKAPSFKAALNRSKRRTQTTSSRADWLTPVVTITAFLCISVPIVYAQVTTPKTVIVHVPAPNPPDTSRIKKPKSKIIGTSENGYTITFSDCRENEKEHVSCQFTDPDGDSHWVYLPGMPLPKD